MGTDTTYITTAATHFDGYARDLREHARTLTGAEGVRWASDSAEDFRACLRPLALHLTTLAANAEQAARSLRAHATAVQNNRAAALVNGGIGTGERVLGRAVDEGEHLVGTIVAPMAGAYRKAESWWG